MKNNRSWHTPLGFRRKLSHSSFSSTFWTGYFALISDYKEFFIRDIFKSAMVWNELSTGRITLSFLSSHRDLVRQTL